MTAGALFALTKPRLAFFSILTAMAAFGYARPAVDAVTAITAFIGISLCAGGALSMNQWWERNLDGFMRRTRSRPLPSQRVSPASALTWTVTLCVGGVGLLAVKSTPEAAAIAATIIIIYGFVYTPLKRRTRWATEIGSISGALPPLLGNAAAGDLFSEGGWILAAILLFWQMPHFFAIGWMYRQDYRNAGFPLLPATDTTGAATAWWSLIYTGLLVLATLWPWLSGSVGNLYGVVIAAANVVFFWTAFRFVKDRDQRDRAARRLFVASIVYLPVVMLALLLDLLF